MASRDENIISNSDGIILPGVWSFEKGTNNLKKYNLVNILNITPLLANLITIIQTTITNFIIIKFFVFKA